MACATGYYGGTGTVQNIDTGLGSSLKSVTIVRSEGGTYGTAYKTDMIQNVLGTDKFIEDSTKLSSGIKINSGGIFTLTGTTYNKANYTYCWEARS